MGILRYPHSHYGTWRWSEANTTSNEGMKAAHPCMSHQCDGHSNAHTAQLHHAIWFCDHAEIEAKLEKDSRKRCAGCEQWTTQRVRFLECPFDDWVVVCHGCYAREHLKIQHFMRRNILPFIRSHVEALPRGVIVRERYNPAYTTIAPPETETVDG